ncbi:hypothetical protein [Komagataeibacter sp. FNDCR2]|uniref:hypothetical protein n=1 Tax=Komagataeibacter sp. FNDCR2 TaxID=2878682 RepID=UPI001E3D6DBF|nr:hypothetical protein [Komagataeibacter sp. FNDCR2]MCE2574247.1 hypothetical protein [Komagataeibacter sp. FNDCR2]
MTIAVSLSAWVIGLSCHAWLHPDRYGLPHPPLRYRIAVRGMRMLAPFIALVFAIRHDAIAGILAWCMTFSIAGVVVALALLPGLRHRDGSGRGGRTF